MTLQWSGCWLVQRLLFHGLVYGRIKVLRQKSRGHEQFQTHPPNQKRQLKYPLKVVRVQRAVFLALILNALTVVTAPAHSPFESSTRAIVHDQTVELVLTVGMDGGTALLKDAPPGAFQVRTVQPNFSLPLERGAQLYEVTAGGIVLSPNKVEVRTDGLEFNFLLEYPRPAGNVLGLRAVFIHTLPSSFKSSFVMTDEMGNILGSSFLSQQENTFAVTLPAPVQLAATTPAGIATPMPKPAALAPWRRASGLP